MNFWDKSVKTIRELSLSFPDPGNLHYAEDTNNCNAPTCTYGGFRAERPLMFTDRTVRVVGKLWLLIVVVDTLMVVVVDTLMVGSLFSDYFNWYKFLCICILCHNNMYTDCLIISF